MALDGAFVACLKRELEEQLTESRVDKIHQPTKEEIVLFMRRKEGTQKLYFSVRAASPRVHFVTKTPENPASPPMFCMLLRKRLSGGRLLSIRQEGFERVLYFDFECLNELGDRVRLTLAMEMMGRHSNLILIDEENKVVDAIKRIYPDMSSVRPILPNAPYTLPPKQADRWDISTMSCERLLSLLQTVGDLPFSEALLKVTCGLSPLLCREVAFRVTGGADTVVSCLSETERVRLQRQLETVQNTACGVPCLVLRADGSPMEYSFLPLTQYGLELKGERLPSFSALLERFYTEKDDADRMNQRSRDTRQVLITAHDRLVRKLTRQREEQQRSTDRESYRIWAELIHANMGLIPKGASQATLINYYDPACAEITVSLDPSLSAAENAQKYYKEYRKAQTAEKTLAQQIEQGEQELQYLDTVLDALSRITTAQELSELRRELSESGYLRLPLSRRKDPAPLGPLGFRSDDGYRILVGRHNVQNDRLTLKIARGSDIWFHTKNIPGSHVVVLTEGKTPPDRTLEQAAVLAAYHSKASDSAQVPVDYTAIKNVKKPVGARPGKVIYDVYTTAYVTPDKELVERLREK